MKSTGTQYQTTDRFSFYFAVGAGLVSAGFLRLGFDPINAPRLLFLTLLTGILFSILVANYARLIKISKIKFGFFFLTVISLCIPFFFADSPKLQQFYGVQGRNTGFLAYFCLAALFLFTTQIGSQRALGYFHKTILVVGMISIGISFGEMFGINILGVNNVYKASIGTFGNPNFQSAFLGIFSAVLLATMLSQNTSFRNRFLLFISYCLTILAILQTKSKQGMFVLVLCLATIIFIYIWKRSVSKVVLLGYSFILFVSGIFSVLGMLNRGPLADLIFKESLGYRYQYWISGINMIQSHFFSGVGLNSFGDYYREYRPATALISPGTEVTTNSSHNVIIDHGATSGVLFMVLFLGIVFYVLFTGFLVLKKLSRFEPVFVGLYVAWVGYLLQSIISIDNLGLAIWGWILPGLILASRKVYLVKEETTYRGPNATSKPAFSDLTGVIMLPIVVMAVIVSVLPIKNDMATRDSLEKADALKAVESVRTFPMDTSRSYLVSYSLFNSGLYSESLGVAKQSVDFNSRDFGSWRLIFRNPASDTRTKNEALRVLRGLDPKNIQPEEKK
jgi:hypothetical protein